MPSKKSKKEKEQTKAVEQFKVSTHFLVPKHELLSKEEAIEITKKYNASLSQFPYILSSDPMAKEIGAKPGDLIKITRRSETAGSTVYYRYVVEA
jgi:DNA-directed RNA polymerase subunit H